MLVTRFALHQELNTAAGQIWWTTALFNTGLVAIIAGLLQLSYFRQHYQWCMAAVGGSIMVTTLFLSIALQDPRLAQGMTYIVMLLIIIVTLALRLSVLVSFLTCLSGGLIGISIAYALFNKSPDWWYLLHYFVGALGVSLFVAWTLERQERLGFLKSILLEYEAQERERLNLELAQLARQDTLTKLANRRCFDERLLEEWDRSLRGQHELALLFLDVDHFKKYNDTYGHSAGDDCLAAVARVIHESLKRPADLASRYGGEEFVVLLPETTRKGATEVAERILLGIEALSIPHAASTTAACVTVSIGLTSCIPDTGLAQVLLDAADSALYSAKHSGRNRIVSTAESTLKVASS